MTVYRLKTVKHKGKEYSYIKTFSSFDHELINVCIIGKNISDKYITYNYYYDRDTVTYGPYMEYMQYNVSPYTQNTEVFDYLKVYTYLKNKNIPDKIIKKFMNQVITLYNEK